MIYFFGIYFQIGQGRFGKVYTAVNNSTGELMAMKEIAIQPGETKAIRNVAEELKIFEGISHKNLVKLYGVEIHRVSIYYFAVFYFILLTVSYGILCFFFFNFSGGVTYFHGIVFRRYFRKFSGNVKWFT